MSYDEYISERFLKNFKGKTAEEIMEICRIEKEQAIQADKDQQIADENLRKEILDHKYYKINHNGTVIDYVRVTSIRPFSCDCYQTLIDNNKYEMRFEAKRSLNLLWFKDNSHTKVNKLTQEEYEKMQKVYKDVADLLKSRL